MAELGERLARLESAQDWTKVVLALVGAITIGGFAFLGVQIGRLDGKFDALGTRISSETARLDGKIDALNARMSTETAALRRDMTELGNSLAARISAENAATRQELVGVATAIANSITAARQFQPQILPVPPPAPKQPGSGSSPEKP